MEILTYKKMCIKTQKNIKKVLTYTFKGCILCSQTQKQTKTVKKTQKFGGHTNEISNRKNLYRNLK